jgi:hypothetical protein
MHCPDKQSQEVDSQADTCSVMRGFVFSFLTQQLSDNDLGLKNVNGVVSLLCFS